MGHMVSGICAGLAVCSTMGMFGWTGKVLADSMVDNWLKKVGTPTNIDQDTKIISIMSLGMVVGVVGAAVFYSIGW